MKWLGLLAPGTTLEDQGNLAIHQDNGVEWPLAEMTDVTISGQPTANVRCSGSQMASSAAPGVPSCSLREHRAQDKAWALLIR